MGEMAPCCAPSSTWVHRVRVRVRARVRVRVRLSTRARVRVSIGVRPSVRGRVRAPAGPTRPGCTVFCEPPLTKEQPSSTAAVAYSSEGDTWSGRYGEIHGDVGRYLRRVQQRGRHLVS